jgi:ribonucleoside-diphosphate reductase beta chain
VKKGLFKAKSSVASHDADINTALDYFTKERPSFAQRLLAFVCVEGIFFSGSFCAIYWLKNRGLMPGLCTSNEFISRDENLHCEFAIELYKLACEPLAPSVVHDVFREAVDIEKEFVTESLPVSLIGMNAGMMKEYIEYVADRWLVQLGYPKLYGKQNPFSFMELISLNQKTSFFESTVSNYQRAGVNTKEEDRGFSLDEDF